MFKIFFIPVIILLFSCSGNQPEKKKENSLQEQNTEVGIETLSLSEKSNRDSVFSIEVSDIKMVYFKGGTFLMGSAYGLPQEQPVHEVTIKAYYIDESPVTVEQFSTFIQDTGYKTEAEKFGDSGVFNLDRQNWELLPGAFWQKPFGPSGPDAEHDHPVTHVSWNDAVAYAKWAGKRLPTEAEWEFAARSGKNSNQKFSWGNEITVEGKYFANTWQGTLQAPETSDGFLYTSPVGVFGENEAGLTDMGGNIWQWCADNYKSYPGSSSPVREDQNVKVIRGGSFFFDEYGEDSFSVSGRSKNSHETSLFNTGFRCAKDVSAKN